MSTVDWIAIKAISYLGYSHSLHYCDEGEQVAIVTTLQHGGNLYEAVQQSGSLHRIPSCHYAQGDSLGQVEVSVCVCMCVNSIG